jgi:hypothetical protein
VKTPNAMPRAEMKHIAAVAVLASITVSCGSHANDITACIPPAAIAVASLDLDRLRAAPVSAKLPQSVLAFADTYRDARQLLVAWSGSGLLIVVRGSAPGATTFASNLAIMGSADSMNAAIAQYHTGKPGAPLLLDYANRTAGGVPFWVAIKGGNALPLTGNTRNVNRLLRDLDYASLAANLDSEVKLRLSAHARSAAGASEFEENLRALLSLAAAAEARSASLATLLNSVQVRRDAVTTTASVTIPAEALDALLRALKADSR